MQQMHVMDFAGGNVVHVNAGVAGVVAAMYFGRRRHISASHQPNLTYLTIGASILWIGWFGFNAGSAHSIISAGMLIGAIAGLVAVTPACAYISPVGAIVIGSASGLVCFIFASLKGVILHNDDALDAFGIHGVGGIVGSLLMGY